MKLILMEGDLGYILYIFFYFPVISHVFVVLAGQS